MADSTREPVLDLSVLGALRDLGGDDDPLLFLEIVNLYLEDAAAHVSNLRTALDSEDLDQVARTAHTLKSSSANVGAAGLARLCAELEHALRSAQFEAAPSLVASAEVQFSAVREALQSELA